MNVSVFCPGRYLFGNCIPRKNFFKKLRKKTVLKCVRMQTRRLFPTHFLRKITLDFSEKKISQVLAMIVDANRLEKSIPQKVEIYTYIYAQEESLNGFSLHYPMNIHRERENIFHRL